ncbi:MAG: hypothetical protein SOW20_07825 [Berryella intestinalis]|uniref:hypothetical protein n=1 Tax=Berryella intestinalis TaxID=1531429 RepID=UPI002A7648CE|nr:hypothetical protein [Berryella intestinalis]MDY3129912.1 hypothetical protein [Berryella intestinalis]
MIEDDFKLSRRCMTCAYSEPPKEGSICGSDVAGICRRNPPVVAYGGDDRFYTEWPTVEEFDWCGEWRER